MFARMPFAFLLACLLAASPAVAVEDVEIDAGISPDKVVMDETIATGSESSLPLDADG